MLLFDFIYSMQCEFYASVSLCVHWELCHIHQGLHHQCVWADNLHLGESWDQVHGDTLLLRHRGQWQQAGSLRPQHKLSGQCGLRDRGPGIPGVTCGDHPGQPVASHVCHMVLHRGPFLALHRPAPDLYGLQVPKWLRDSTGRHSDFGSRAGLHGWRLWPGRGVCGPASWLYHVATGPEPRRDLLDRYRERDSQRCCSQPRWCGQTERIRTASHVWMSWALPLILTH